MITRLRTGIVGCGKVAEIHAAALKNLKESDFAAVTSRQAGKSGAFAARHGVKAYTDVKKMVQQERLDAVIICTPHPAHAAPAIEAMQAGAHCLVEKPLAASLKDCDAMLAAARENNVKLGTVCQRRFYEPCQRIRKAIDDGKIGHPVLGVVNMFGWRDQAYYQSDPWRGTWEGEGGGVLVNQAPHQLDLLLWYMGEIDSLYGQRANLNHPFIEVEDTAVAVIRFRSGAIGNVMVSNSQNPALYGKVCIYGSNGAAVGVQTDGGAMFIAGMSNIAEPPVNDYWTVPGEKKLLGQWRKQDKIFFRTINPIAHYHQLQVQDFLQAVIGGRDLLVTGEAGRRTVELFTAVYRSWRDAKPVRFPLASEGERGDFNGRGLLHTK